MLLFNHSQSVIGKILRRSLAVVLLNGTILYAFSAETNAVLKLRFMTNSAGETIVRQGETNRPLNLTQALKNKGAQYSLIPEDATVALESQQFPGWGAELPPRQTASFGFDYARRILMLSTAIANEQTVRLRFPDGANAEMDANADGRLEYLDDGTYAFFGAGSMTGTNADGAPVRFGNVFPPMMGGQLIAPKTTNFNARFTRTSPVAQLTVLGQIDTEISAKIGNQVVSLETGAAKEIKTANGAAIVLRHNPETRSLEWTVQRGLFRINVDSFRCWKALGTSGQSASMQWDTNGFLIELKNKNGAGSFQKTVLVNLNSTLNVAVGDSASFQYGRIGDCSTFLAAASGGETTLYNAQSGKFVRLDSGNMNIVSGWPDTMQRGAASSAKAKVRMAWAASGSVELKGADGEVISVDLNQQGVLETSGCEVQISNGGPDKVGLRADSGDVAVTPDFMPGISIEISGGAAVQMGYDSGSEIFRVSPDPSNLSPVGLRTPAGFFPSLTAGSQLTFVINRSNFSVGSTEGALIFAETAGAGAEGGGAAPIAVRTLPSGRGDLSILSSTSQTLDVSRIEQPPVTSSE